MIEILPILIIICAIVCIISMFLDSVVCVWASLLVGWAFWGLAAIENTKIEDNITQQCFDAGYVDIKQVNDIWYCVGSVNVKRVEEL